MYDYLCKKIKCSTGQLARIMNVIPTDLHKDLYHTLVESHLRYGISAWGGVSANVLSPLFILQKKCIRILFGDRQKYLDRFNTAARTRPFVKPFPTPDFTKEHTKPLFNDKGLLTIHNIYFYHCLLEVFKILKFRSPISLYDAYKMSGRKQTLIVLDKQTRGYISRSSTLWNDFRTELGIHDFAFTIGKFKMGLKKRLMKSQMIGSPDEWCEENYKF